MYDLPSVLDVCGHCIVYLLHFFLIWRWTVMSVCIPANTSKVDLYGKSMSYKSTFIACFHKESETNLGVDA